MCNVTKFPLILLVNIYLHRRSGLTKKKQIDRFPRIIGTIAN